MLSPKISLTYIHGVWAFAVWKEWKIMDRIQHFIATYTASKFTVKIPAVCGFTTIGLTTHYPKVHLPKWVYCPWHYGNCWASLPGPWKRVQWGPALNAHAGYLNKNSVTYDIVSPLLYDIENNESELNDVLLKNQEWKIWIQKEAWVESLLQELNLIFRLFCVIQEKMFWFWFIIQELSALET